MMVMKNVRSRALQRGWVSARLQNERAEALYYKPRRQGAKAFTIIEIILVVLIISLIAALAVPSVVNALRGQQLDSAAHNLAVACQQARYEALFGGRTCWYVIDFDKQTVQLLQGPPLETNVVLSYQEIAAETNIVESGGGEVKESFDMPSHVKITSVQIEAGT